MNKFKERYNNNTTCLLFCMTRWFCELCEKVKETFENEIANLQIMSSICYYSMFVFQSTYIFCSSSNVLVPFMLAPFVCPKLHMQISLCAHSSAICMPAWQPSKSIRNGTTTKFVCVREITLIYGHLCAEHSQSIIEYSYVRKCLRSYSRSPHSILQANNCSGWSVLSQMSQLKLV